jgi:hypothetical protein
VSNKYASGKHAIGYCDRCGFECKLNAMRAESVAGSLTGVRVCPMCYDPDHPQNFQGRYPISDPQALRDARPDPALEASRIIPP